jgi:hypothetical protein
MGRWPQFFCNLGGVGKGFALFGFNLMLPWILSRSLSLGIFFVGRPPPAVMNLNLHPFIHYYPVLTKTGFWITVFGLAAWLVAKVFHKAQAKRSRRHPVRRIQISLQFIFIVISVSIILLELLRQRDSQLPALLYSVLNAGLFLKLVTSAPPSTTLACRYVGLSLILAATFTLCWAQYVGTAVVIQPIPIGGKAPDIRGEVRQLVPIVFAACAVGVVGGIVRTAIFRRLDGDEQSARRVEKVT